MGKRGNGEGSIYRRKDGRWAGQHTVQTVAGVKRKTVYGKTRAEVAAKLTKAMAESENGFAFDAGKTTVGAYLDSWLADSVRGNVRPSTFVRSETLVRLHIKPVLGRVKLAALGPAHVQGLYRAKLDQGLSPTTVHRIHEVLRTALKLAVRWRLVPRNACDAVTVPRRTKPEIRPLDQDQARAFLKAAEGEHYEAFFVLALTAGLRLGELRGLRWDAVDLRHRRVHVRRTLVRAGDVLVFGEPKTAKGRVVALTPRAVGSLNRHEEMQRAAGRYEENGLVFKTPRADKPIDYRHLIYRYFRPLLERAGLPTIRLHDLRHTCATLLLTQGVHPKIVADVLGHANISMTLDTYSHVLPHMQSGAADAMRDALEDD